MQLKSIDANEIKTRWAEVLLRVRLGEGFCITQRGVPVAELVPNGSFASAISANAASRMKLFMQAAPIVQAVDIEKFIQAGRD